MTLEQTAKHNYEAKTLLVYGRNPAYDGPCGIFEDYEFCHSEEEHLDGNVCEGEGKGQEGLGAPASQGQPEAQRGEAKPLTLIGE